jgi:hypothetical protein
MGFGEQIITISPAASEEIPKVLLEGREGGEESPLGREQRGSGQGGHEGGLLVSGPPRPGAVGGGTTILGGMEGMGSIGRAGGRRHPMEEPPATSGCRKA